MRDPELGQEDVGRNTAVGQKERGHGIAAVQFTHGLIGISRRICVDQEAIVFEICNPVFRNSHRTSCLVTVWIPAGRAL